LTASAQAGAPASGESAHADPPAAMEGSRADPPAVMEGSRADPPAVMEGSRADAPPSTDSHAELRAAADAVQHSPPSGSGGHHSARTVEQPGTPARAPERERVQLGTVIGGRYRITRFVAEGAFGAVYRAQDLDINGHEVALKLLHRASASEAEHARCLREVQLIAAVSHPSVVSFKDHGFHRGRFYIVMPWYQGETLADRLAERGALSRREALRIFRSLAEALAAMHERGIRHQDVKPENILLARLGEGQEDFPVLLDLGVGAFSHEQVPAFTAAYVAPEMARAHLSPGEPQPPVDGKADVFALALTLFDALMPGARDMPVSSATDDSLRLRLARGADVPWAEPLRDIRPELSRWLARDPQARPSARQLAHELRVLVRAEERRAERRRLLMRAGPALCLVLSLAFVLAVQLRREQVSSRRKDWRIERQALEIDQAREAIDALSGARRATLQDYLDLKRRSEGLARDLVNEKQRGAQLEGELSSERLRAHEEQARVSGASERVLLLERELAAAEQRLAETEAQRVEAQRELARLRRSSEAAHGALRREKADLAALVRELVKERDQLSEKLSELSRARALLAKRAPRAEKQAQP
jgi:serine/threonine protein kinase